MDLRMNGPVRLVTLLAATFLFWAGGAQSQQTYKEDFTNAATQLSWFATGGTCLTAGTLAAAPVNPPGNIIGCTANLSAYYKLQPDQDKALVGGSNGTFPDPVGKGALRFTNGYPYGHFERGSLVSGFTFPTAQGISISFNTVTYLGDSGGNGKDGADGISFFLMDACVPIPGATPPAGCDSNVYGSTGYNPVGATGGSLGYSCSDRNAVFNGLPGAFLGLGIDEFGNFLNGTANTLGDTNGVRNSSFPADNTADGGYYDPGRIGLRGAGNVNWQYLNYKYNSDPGSGTSNTPYYPACASSKDVYDPSKDLCESCTNGGKYSVTTHSCSSGSIQDKASLTAQEIYNTCSTGYLYNFNNSSSPHKTTQQIADYAAIDKGWTNTATIGGPIAAEGATTRGKATPIVYNLQITPDNKLSFQLSYNGGAYQNILTNTDFSAASSTIPQNLRFGFTGATGGDTNVHELLCFQAAPNNLSASGAGNNNFQNPQLIPGSQLFLGSYFPTQAWAGSVTAQTIGFDPTSGSVKVAPLPNWDASCVLTQAATCASGAPNTVFETAANRQILTYNSGNAYAFKYNSLPTALKNALDGDDSPAGSGVRVSYLRGDRTNEIPKGLKLFRTRTSVLGDVIDSTPTLVGPPNTYPSDVTWVDLLSPTTVQKEQASGAQTYAAFQSAWQTRANVVYVGANDGMLHGFRAGAFDSNNDFTTTTTPNDGYEVLAYVPGVVAQAIHNTASPNLDPSSTHYTHAYFVDATVATGDVFYGNSWHTWLVGGLGAGAAPGIYALEVTDPGKFKDTNTTTVLGEWTPGSISGGCRNSSNCGDSMGSISGVPQIRRLHDGKWGVIFGNGVGSASGDAGIFIMLIDQNNGSSSFLYLSSGMSGTKNAKPDGIVAASPADLDGDHIVDYVYAGDIQGNVWRFDLTSSDESKWSKSQYSPLFREPNSLPITTKVTVSTLRQIDTRLGLNIPAVTRRAERVVINFATGRMIPQTPTAPTQYAAGPHTIYGIWDADMSGWNANKNTNQPVVSFAANTPVPTITSTANLQGQTIKTTAANGTTPAFRTVSTNTVCWPPDPPGTPNDNPLDTPANCTPVNQMGWFLTLPGAGGTDPTLDEQVIFDPIISPDGEFLVNTFIAANTSPLLCQIQTPTGFTMALNPGTGAGSPLPFFVIVNGQINADGVQLNGTGVPLLVQSGQSADMNAEYLVTQTSSGQAAPPVRTNTHTVVTGERLNWIERR
ncbi:MAG: type pilus assembly protein PilY1 [Gammaproteobacteria bacterium]|nr:type pilus assembly protein PilY1 [Gammaproteobacteria bacterium]